MVPENIKEIARRFLSGAATEEEITLLHQWYDTWDDEETIIQADTDNPDAIEARMLSRLLEQIRQKETSPARVVTQPQYPWWKVAVAAAIIVTLGLSFFFWYQRSTSQGALAVTDTPAGIQPGIDRALLILDDGRQVVLDSSATGIVSKQGNTTIINMNGQLTYKDVDNQQENTSFYNTIRTAKGNQYQLILPDGSKAWLNAASSLRFPTRFTAQERIVELTGEGYFEVAKNKDRPFKVLIPPQKEGQAGTSVEVLGTHFNINAYPDEEAMKTTLLEGKVKISTGNQQPVLLKPGEQAIATPHLPLVVNQSPDIDQVMAWKNGYFQFTDAPITMVMRQAARWYNVEVVYKGNVQQEIFSGSIPRSASITQLIKILELTKTVKINIEGRKLIASPY